MLHSRIKRLSINKKLLLLGTLTTGCSLLLAGAALFAFEIQGFRDALLRKVTTQAEIIAYNAASAVIFGDDDAARLTLAALRSEPYLRSAVIYDEDGRLFAQWKKESSIVTRPTLPRELIDRTHVFEQGELALYQPIVVENKRVGTLLLRSDMKELGERVSRFAIVALGVLAASLVAASLVYSLIQRAVSRPILELADVARSVSTRKDYSVRATSSTEDEISVLVDAFNDMLGQIERRENELRGEVEAREHAQQALARQAEELIRSNRELENFAYVASHDLQEPLRMVASYTELLADEYRGKLDDDADEYIDFAVGGAKRMQNLIQALLSYSRISTEAVELGPVDVDSVLENVLLDLRAPIAESGAVITRSPMPKVMGAPARLHQVFQNLIGNALKYRQERPQIHIDAVASGEECVLSVRDNGIGIEPKYFERVFQMFQRLHTQSEFDGTGIGLALCQKIVESHGGRIWVESTPGAGSCFFFSTMLAEHETGAGARIPPPRANLEESQKALRS